MLQVAQHYSREVAGFLAVLLAFALNRVFRPKAKLIYSVRHAFTFLVDQPLLDPQGNQISASQTIHTASISVSNLGIQPAKNVEVAFNWKPQFINVWPARSFETKDSAQGRHSVVLDSLAPSEVFGMEILSINVALPGITAVRSDESVGTSVAMIPQPIHPRWNVVTVGVLIVLGVAAVGYLTAAFVEFASQ